MLDAIIDGRYCIEYGLYVAERPRIPTPEHRVETYTVDYRDGELVRKKGLSNINFPVEFNILENYNIKQNLREIKAWLMNAETIRFTDDDVHYRIKYTSIDDIENDVDCYGYFTVNFTCDPFQYAPTNSFVLTSGKTIINIGTYVALPKITIYGSGDMVLTVNGSSITLKAISEYIVLDSELMDAYKGIKNMNSCMVGTFPVLEVGKNEVGWSGAVEKIVMEPRWRYL